MLYIHRASLRSQITSALMGQVGVSVPFLQEDLRQILLSLAPGACHPERWQETRAVELQGARLANAAV